MDKKDIYEHLAKIYLDASSKKKKKSKPYSKLIKNTLLLSFVFVLALGGSVTWNLRNKNPFNSETALVLVSERAKINFNFDPAKKENFSIILKQLNIGRFNAVAFSIKKVNPLNNVSLRVEFVNSFKERSEVYLKDIPNRWQDFTLSLAEFKNITDWSEMSNLIFTVEEWNTKDKNGVVYIDNVRLLK